MKRLWLPLTYLTPKKAGESVRGAFDFIKWFNRLLSDGVIEVPSPSPIVVTKAEVDTLVATSALTVGQQYKLTGVDVPLYGGTDIVLTAVTTSQFSLKGSGIFYNPKYDQSTAWRNNGFRVWKSTSSYLAGARVIWGGKHWDNLTGVTGSSLSKWELDTTNWAVVPFNSTDYNVSIDTIEYDFNYDTITYRADNFGNEVRASYDFIKKWTKLDDWNYLDEYGNPIKVFQWGNNTYEYSNAYDYNQFAYGVFSNRIEFGIFDCINFTGKTIFGNEINYEATITLTTNWEGCTFSENKLGRRNSSNYRAQIRSNNFKNATLRNNVILSGGIYGTTQSASNLGYTISNNILNDASIDSNVFNAAGATILSNDMQAGQINSNVFNTSASIYANRLTNGSNKINSNTFNTVTASIQYNNLAASSQITSCTFNPTVSNTVFIRYNKLNGSTLTGLTLGTASGFNYNNVDQSTLTFTSTGSIASKIIQDTTFSNVSISSDLSTATIIYGNYHKDVVKRADGTIRITYINNSDIWVITAITT